MTFTVGTTDPTDYVIDLTGSPTNSVEDLRDAINASDAPVTATIINTGSGANPHRLVLTADDTGTEADFSVAFSDAGMETALGLTTLQTAQDASFVFDGLAITRSSNTVNDLVPGLTLELNGTTPADETVELTVNVDGDGIRKNVEDFVDAYNDLVSLLDSQNEVSEDGSTNALLFGDSSVRMIMSRLRSEALTQVEGLTSALDSLSSVGIRTDSSGQLSLDQTDFDDALTSDLDGVVSLFTDASDGIAQRVIDLVDEITDAENGIIQARQDGIDRRTKTIDNRIDAMERRLDNREQQLIDRFASFEQLMGSFQTRARP